jgi:hypothetical protein
LRFADVIEELREVADLAAALEPTAPVAEACRRLQDLLHALREQFLDDVVLRTPA